MIYIYISNLKPLEMKMAITNLFIKERFDLERFAPKATVDFPRFKEME